MIKIENNRLAVTIDEKGAELQSIKYNDTEYLWQADKNYWGKHAPVLFPIVGELKDGKYIFNGCEYILPRHGFAREKVFELKDLTKTSASFILKADEESLKVYPFLFVLEVKYVIKNKILLCSYTVQNTDVKTMYFSVGGHPAFNVPLSKDLQYTDYFLKFNNDSFLEKHLLQNGLITDDKETITLDNGTLPLHPFLFYKDAIVLKNISSNAIELRTTKNVCALKFNFSGFPYFGIWSAKDAPFICLEPWCGIADNIHHNYFLTHKEGINILPADEHWQRTWSVELF